MSVIKNKKIYGIILAAFFAVDLFLIVKSAANVLSYIAFIPKIILIVSYFFPSEKIHRKIIAVSFFLTAAVELYYYEYWYLSYREIFFSNIFCIIMCGLVGYLIITDYKYKKMSVIVPFVFVMVIAFQSFIYSNFHYVLNNNFLSFIFFYTASISIPELIIVLLDIIGEIEKKKDASRHEILINTDVIDFKDMLGFIENEFKAGNLTAEEYRIKRNEILSKI